MNGHVSIVHREMALGGRYRGPGAQAPNEQIRAAI